LADSGDSTIQRVNKLGFHNNIYPLNIWPLTIINSFSSEKKEYKWTFRGGFVNNFKKIAVYSTERLKKMNIVFIILQYICGNHSFFADAGWCFTKLEFEAMLVND